MSEIIPNTSSRKIPVSYHPSGCFEATGASFRFILVGSEPEYIQFNGEKRLMLTPAIFCLNEKDQVGVSAGTLAKAETLAFHPRIINQSLTLENISERSINSVTEKLDIDILRAFVRRDRPMAGQYHVGPATFQRAKQLVQAIASELTAPSDQFWPCRSRSCLFELLFLLFRLGIAENPVNELPSRDETGRIDQVILYLARNYHQKITIAKLTREFNINRTTLCHQFHEATGIPLISYLIKLRMKLASLLIKETTLPMAEIMEKVGYSDLTHFGRLFKKEMGCTPNDFRKMNRT